MISRRQFFGYVVGRRGVAGGVGVDLYVVCGILRLTSRHIDCRE